MNQLPELSSETGREILAFFDFLPTRFSNGLVEGNNNWTKALMGQGYGIATVTLCAGASYSRWLERCF